MALSSAPGKVYLFGEHAVVYGEPAVPCAIERRARVGVQRRDDGKLRVHAEDLSLDGFTVEYDGSTGNGPDVDVSESLLSAAMGYVDGAIEQVRDVTGEDEVGFDVTIESDIPLGAGLGSSAAVVVAAIDAATRELGVTLETAELAERAYRTEHMVQDGQASRADTFCSATGGAVRVEGDDCRSLEAPDLPIVIGFDGGAGDTGQLVAGVRDLRDEYDFAADTVGAIGDVVRNGEEALANGDVEELGRLMNFNHGLLSALGVSSRSLDTMVWAARDAGAHGAKLTGAGGGGCIVALDPTPETETALSFTPGCEDAFRAELTENGVTSLE
ncbi:mevalonate kinase [Natrinema halophilum]|uniref:Mevalonate kinase n=1 Tax=Natrinema halophilum TaxID=1699371 RepID=A0A7D5GRS5_9EURY|nr:mevalonate kinase [Natrinema halophilum]QLG48226.1 mevalonate kinase [Natrinema halophilum]